MSVDHRNHRRSRGLLLKTLPTALLLALGGSAAAATLNVNSLADNTTSGDGLVTLREAILASVNRTATDLGQIGTGSDTLSIANGTNVSMEGGSGNSTLLASGGSSITMFGGAGNDSLASSGAASITMIGGTGQDSLSSTNDTGLTIIGGSSGATLTVTGGSSITQQLVKNLYIPRDERSEKSIDRKMRELVFAIEVTKETPKEQILEWYLNEISYGGIYSGVEAASQGYFGKSASELTLGEATLLAGIPQSPSAYEPRANLDAALVRRNDVIALMGRWNWWLPPGPARLLRVQPSLPPRVASEADRG